MKYQHLSEIDHILKRPDINIGSTTCVNLNRYIIDDGKIVQESVLTSDGIERIFIEVLANSIDNIVKSFETETKCTEIKVNIKDNIISIYNDGDYIKISKNENDMNMYNHDMVFGILRTSSNYDDSNNREICGKNGLGIKCTNIFSKSFKVEANDPHNKLSYYCEWTNNMKTKEDSIIKKSVIKKGFTKITYEVDFTKFINLIEYGKIIKIFEKILYDSAFISKFYNVKIFLNDLLINIKNIKEYVHLFLKSPENLTTYVEIIYKRQICVLSQGNFINNDHVSFVNNLLTPENGKHVDVWKSKICSIINSKFKINNFSKHIDKNFKLFIICHVDKPEYNSQSKFKLIYPSPDIEIDEKYKKKILSIKSLKSIIQNMEKTEEVKKIKKMCSVKKIDNISYDPPNKHDPNKNVLILCEGLSAKTYAVAGLKYGFQLNDITYIGRTNVGIYPLRGKLLNVRNVTKQKLYSNKVIFDLIQILNIKDGNLKNLSFNKILIIPDPDTDGIHIEGLIINFFDVFCPELLKRNFIFSMKIPIVKADNNLFFSMSDYENYSKNNISKKIKYFKGLGTSSLDDIKTTFGKKIINYIYDEKTDYFLELAFLKTKTEERKEWIKKYNSESVYNINNSIGCFIDKQLILYSIEDCKRSIPHSIDGLKDSQRKVIYGILKYNNKKSIKVAQLGAYIAQITDYKHGEQNLFETIVKMAQNFCGSNNYNLLKDEGMFGSRLEGGKDFANPRYIYTNSTEFLHLVFRKEDDVLYDKNKEPDNYFPIIPLLLLNGSIGIGTGFYCNVPCYNIKDIIESINYWLDNKCDKKYIKEIHPYYNNFKGNIIKKNDCKYETFGCFVYDDNLKLKITELPINYYPCKFKETLIECEQNGIIKSWDNNCDIKNVNFDIILSKTLSNEEIVKIFKLKTYLNSNNIVVFSCDGKIKEFNLEKFMYYFMKNRYNAYIERKNVILKEMEKNIIYDSEKLKFIKDVVNSKIKIFKKTEEYICEKYEQINGKKINEQFLKIPLINFTSKIVESMENKIKKQKEEYEVYYNTSIKQIWKSELNDIQKYIDNME